MKIKLILILQKDRTNYKFNFKILILEFLETNSLRNHLGDHKQIYKRPKISPTSYIVYIKKIHNFIKKIGLPPKGPECIFWQHRIIGQVHVSEDLHILGSNFNRRCE